eukprot:scaffold2581_cov143-Amphora_coffeaeformis.AAC.1
MTSYRDQRTSNGGNVPYYDDEDDSVNGHGGGRRRRGTDDDDDMEDDDERSGEMDSEDVLTTSVMDSAGAPSNKRASLRGDGYGRSSGTLYRRLAGQPDIQSHNYEPDESEVWRAYTAQVHFSNRGQWWTTGKKRALKRWVLTFFVGVVQAFVAAGCNFGSRFLSKLKFDHVYDLLKESAAVNPTATYATTDDLYVGDVQTAGAGSHGAEDDSNGGSGWNAFLAFLLYQTIFGALASLFVWIEPVAGGSGIPEVKCFLNGIDLPRIVRVKTLVCKVIGVLFSTAAGLPVGKEGPMVHSGAVVAAGISQDFRNDREKRDFVACGAAAGVASAFGAPIGGVLFSLEEGASYWSTKLTWRAFFCAMTTLATLFWIRNVDTLWGQANISRLFSFGEFNSLSGESANFSIWELILFVVIGCLGGLIGAVFNAANEHLTIWRMKRINFSKFRRLMEVIAISALCSFVAFLMPLLWNKCTDLPTDMQDWSNQEKDLVEALVPFMCPEGQYNEVASLIFTEPDVAIKQLFHFREAVPSGLFVPSLLSGAAFGRLFGHLLHKLDHTNGTFADSGTYALMGAAAVLGGMARMTISLTVILLEATGDMQYVLPLMLTLMAARFTGNVFNEGLYDIHIHLKKIPFLEPDVPTIAERNEIVAGQAMSTEVKCLRPVERAGVVYDLLRACKHGTFPIVDTASGGTLYGTASRYMLCTLLQRRAFGAPDVLEDYDEPNKNFGPRRLSPLVQWDTIERVYPRYPTIHDVEMRESDRNCWLDLRPYANTAPYTVNETASIQRTYRLFRTLGLRFLCVVNHTNQVVGIITRKDLLPGSLSDSLLRGRNAHNIDDDEREVI